MHASVDYTLTKEAIASTLGGFKKNIFLILEHPQFLNECTSALSAALEVFGSHIKICQATKLGEMKNAKPPCTGCPTD